MGEVATAGGSRAYETHPMTTIVWGAVVLAALAVLIGYVLGMQRSYRRFFKRPYLTVLTLASEGALREIGWWCMRCGTLAKERPKYCPQCRNPYFHRAYVPAERPL